MKLIGPLAEEVCAMVDVEIDRHVAEKYTPADLERTLKV